MHACRHLCLSYQGNFIGSLCFHIGALPSGHTNSELDSIPNNAIGTHCLAHFFVVATYYVDMVFLGYVPNVDVTSTENLEVKRSCTATSRDGEYRNMTSTNRCYITI